MILFKFLRWIFLKYEKMKPWRLILYTLFWFKIIHFASWMMRSALCLFLSCMFTLNDSKCWIDNWHFDSIRVSNWFRLCAFELQVWCHDALQILIPNSISNFSSKFLLENVTRSLTSVDNWQPLYRLGIRIYRIIE